MAAGRTEFSWPLYAAINVLQDVVACFVPAPDYDVFVGPDGTVVRLMDAVRAPIRDAEHHFRRLLTNEGLPQRLRASLCELCDSLEQLDLEEDRG